MGGNFAPKYADAYRRALQLHPEDLRLYYNLGDTYLRIGAYEEAVRICRAGLRRSPGHVNLYYLLAQGQRALGKADEAAGSYRELLKGTTPPELRRRVTRRLRELQSE